MKAFRLRPSTLLWLEEAVFVGLLLMIVALWTFTVVDRRMSKDVGPEAPVLAKVNGG